MISEVTPPSTPWFPDPRVLPIKDTAPYRFSDLVSVLCLGDGAPSWQGIAANQALKQVIPILYQASSF